VEENAPSQRDAECKVSFSINSGFPLDGEVKTFSFFRWLKRRSPKSHQIVLDCSRL